MANADLVDVLNARNNLLRKAAGLLFLQTLALDDVIEELASASVFHDEEKLP